MVYQKQQQQQRLSDEEEEEVWRECWDLVGTKFDEFEPHMKRELSECLERNGMHVEDIDELWEDTVRRCADAEPSHLVLNRAVHTAVAMTLKKRKKYPGWLPVVERRGTVITVRYTRKDGSECVWSSAA